MFKQATLWGLIQASPVPPTKAPRAEKPDLDVPDAETAKALMDAAVGTRWELPVLLAFYTGARRGELLAIGWDQVDFDRRRIRITRSVERINGEFRFKEPKTKRGVREVAVPPFMVERLRAWRAEQNQRRLEAGPAWHDLGLVIDDGAGGPVNPDAFTRAAKRFARKIGRPDIRLHDARHSAASLMMARAVHPSVVSRSLGHASEAFTMQVYGHPSNEMLHQAADALGEAYGNT